MQDLNEFLEYRLSKYLWKSFPPILLVLGTFGNTLAILVLMQRKNRRSTSALFLIALASADILVLWLGLLRQWIKYTFGFDIRDVSVTGCKMHVFLVYTAFHCSSWFLVAFTCERFLAVLFPLCVNGFCTYKNGICLIALLTVGLVLLNSHLFYGVTLIQYVSRNSTTRWICDVVNDDVYQKFHKTWVWIDNCIYSLIPSLLLLIVNLSIILRLVWRRLERRTHVVLASSTKEKLPQITATLITTSLVFVLCTTPISVILIEYAHGHHDYESNTRAFALFSLKWVLVNILSYMNNVLNFVLYFLSGSRFRRQTKDFLFTSLGNCKPKQEINVIT
ncbi:G-protein coupled receptor daf-37-like [Ruditapes philippinarum]|uniref:G-protein coupled receptor daf-37-like n=1 Tax=Ruditapes philippinarum TaxID=129788 RepID=UPI00295AAE0B|nr:G-protein coupled receptor daf-37-like [Ruditapes philippinarum]